MNRALAFMQKASFCKTSSSRKKNKGKDVSVLALNLAEHQRFELWRRC